MTMTTYRHDRERELPPGPWDDEPDKAVWIDPTTDLDCMIHRHRMGALCGYVGVPPGHPAHGVGYSEVDVEVRGGLTYSDFCDESAEATPEKGLCHVPEPGRPAEVWWLGFDCAHAFDLVPSFSNLVPELPMEGDTYRDFVFVKAEVESLARQLRRG